MLNYKVYENQKRTAEKVFNSIQLGNKRIHLVAPTQSGKTGTIIHLANMLPESNFILTSGMMDNHLFNQNSHIAEVAASNVRAVKIHTLLKEPNPKKIVKDLDIKYITIDENHFAIGEDSRLDKFIQELSILCPDVVIIWIGATGYHLINSDIIDDTIQMDVPYNYYGANDILNSGNIIDSKNFEYLSELDSKKRKASDIDYGVKINESMTPLLEHLKSFKNGLGIVRVRSKSIAHVLKESLGNRFPYAKVVVAVSGEGSSIAESIKDAKMLSKSKRIILIVCGGLKAGVDLGDTKSVVRFIVETYKTCASVSQGLVGRVCGYHSNRTCLFVANTKAIELQASYERDFRVVNEEFLSELFDEDKVALATNLSMKKSRDSKRIKSYYGNVYKVGVNDNLNKEWFKGYNSDYLNKVYDLMDEIEKAEGNFRVLPKHHPSKTDRINTIQSGKFKNRGQFDSYLRKMDNRVNFSNVFHRFSFTSEGKRRNQDKINFSSVFHRFADTSEDRKSGGVKGGASNKSYAEAIKVGILYDNKDKTFYIAVRDKEMTDTIVNTKINGNHIFNKTK